MPWSRPFEDPIPLPRGRDLVTLEDAARYITRLPKTEQESPRWQAAAEALIMAAEDHGPVMHARIGMLRALNFGKVAPVVERRKGPKATGSCDESPDLPGF